MGIFKRIRNWMREKRKSKINDVQEVHQSKDTLDEERPKSQTNLIKRFFTRTICKLSPNKVQRKVRIRAVEKGSFGETFLIVDERNKNKVAVRVQTICTPDEESELEMIKILKTVSGNRFFHEIRGHVINRTEDGISQLRIYADYFKSKPLIANFHHENREKIHIILYDILCGLKCLHQNNIIHRNINSHNIWINQRSQIKIANFESATYGPTASGQFGLPTHRAPEMASDEYDFKVDYYAVGVTFYHLIYGVSPAENRLYYDPAKSNRYKNKFERRTGYIKFSNRRVKNRMTESLQDLMEKLMYPKLSVEVVPLVYRIFKNKAAQTSAVLYLTKESTWS